MMPASFIYPWSALLIACCSIVSANYLAASASAWDQRLSSLNQTAITAEAKVVKLFGPGGGGLDSFQSGMLISPQGHILTAWSTVLDVDSVIVHTSDGTRYEASVIGVDPNLEIAILQIQADTPNHFDLEQTTAPTTGDRVLAVSNLYKIATGNEAASVQRGCIMAVTTLNARRGTSESVYQGPVVVTDAMTNNPGAAGGALVALDGRLIGMLGKELRDKNTQTWLNYAVPISELKDSISRIIAGEAISRNASQRPLADRPVNLRDLGIILSPNVLAKTPAFVDLVEPASAAQRAGLQTDDLILFMNSTRIASQQTLLDEVKYVDRGDEIVFLIQRNNELKEVIVTP